MRRTDDLLNEEILKIVRDAQERAWAVGYYACQQLCYDELSSLNEEWFSLTDAEKRVRMQNALGLVTGAT